MQRSASGCSSAACRRDGKDSWRRPAAIHLTLSLWVGQQYRGTPFENARQRVSLGVPEVVEVRRRELSRGRTALLAAGVIALTVVLADRIVFEQDPNATPGGRPGSPPTDPSGTLIGKGVLR